MLLTNVLFGAAHSVNWQYFLFASVFGVYLSWLSGFPGERNLLPAAIAHGVYDGIAFFLIRAEFLDATGSGDSSTWSAEPAEPPSPASGEGAGVGLSEQHR